MAGRRKAPRKRQQTANDTLIWIASIIALIFTLCLCAFNFELASKNDKTAQPTRLDTCRSTCDARLQSAAFESHVPAAMTSTTMDSVFQISDVGQNSTFKRGRESHRTEAELSSTTVDPLKSSQPRPRRLPNLIKILTGFSDEPYWHTGIYGEGVGHSGNKPIIARIEIPHFVSSKSGRRRNDGGSSDDTVQVAAAAAAAAVWSKSIRNFGNNRMFRINAEWDAALRWIAGWDQQLTLDGNFAHGTWGNGEGANRVNENGSSNGDVSYSGNSDGFHDFVDDLAKLLQSCIDQCLENENFDFSHDDKHTFGGSTVGNLVLRSTMSWFVGSSFSRISFGKLDAVPPEVRFIFTGAIQLVVASILVYTLRNAWAWGSGVVWDWYPSFRYNESPEWLVEHERQIEIAKKSQSKQKKPSSSKKSRKKLQQPQHRHKDSSISSGNQSGQSLKQKSSNDNNLHRTRSYDIDQTASDERAQHDEVFTKNLVDESAEEWKHAKNSNARGCKISSSGKNEENPTSFKVTNNPHPITDIEIPSSESLSSTSSSSSPALHSTCIQIEEQDIPHTPLLQGTSNIVSRSLTRDHHATSLTQILRQNSLPVPTQEQRNEAAKQLREFQNAQIQRLLLQKKFARAMTDVSLSSNSIPNSGHLFPSSDTTVSLASSKQDQVVRPPPGFSHAAQNHQFAQDQLDQLDKTSFLADNELILSRLLDDDDEVDKVEDMDVVSTLLNGADAPSESSLDPFAVPFVLDKNEKEDGSPCPQAKRENTGIWPGSVHSSPNTLEKTLNENVGVNVKGVYGGSVW